jgi:hypothetical protein
VAIAAAVLVALAGVAMIVWSLFAPS